MAKKKQKNNKQTQESKEKKTKSVGLTIIAIIFYLSAALMIISGVVFILGQFNIINLTEMLKASGQDNSGLLASGIIALVLGAAYIVIASALLKRKNWARLIALFLSIFIVVNSLFSLKLDLLSLVSFLIITIVRLWIIYYLVKNKEMFKWHLKKKK